jgi:hypothetical protein
MKKPVRFNGKQLTSPPLTIKNLHSNVRRYANKQCGGLGIVDFWITSIKTNLPPNQYRDWEVENSALAGIVKELL